MMKASWIRPSAPTQMHGFVFDLAIFLGSWGLLALNLAALPDRWVGGLLGTAVLTQIGGATLKGRYLPHRLPPTASDAFTRFMQLLLLLHFILFTVMSLLGAALLGWYVPDAAGENGWVLLAFVLGSLATGQVYRATQPALAAPTAQHSAAEYAADALLWLSVLITTALMWDGLFTDLGAGVGVGFTPRGVVLALALAALFVVFYLPARTLFLVEDYRHPATWLRLWLVLLPLLIAIFRG
ncbi:MAG: hypothetical protein WAS33_24625 [Candidatus Promineifilaceae bacterium]